MSDDNTKLRELYIAVWKRMLHECFGWSPREVESWVSPARRRMAAKCTLFYHEDAIFYVRPLCINTTSSIASSGGMTGVEV